MENRNSKKGIFLMLISAFLTAEGQLLWKLSLQKGSIYFLIFGFALYGIGALSMIISFKFGELSVLYPLMCISYIFAIINGYIFLEETIDISKLIGVLLIMAGVVVMNRRTSR